MWEHTIEVTENDAQRLRALLASTGGRHRSDDSSLARLRHELDRAHIVAADQVGRRAVTLQSRVVLRDEETGESSTYTLVHPEHADHDAGRLSVLAPIGTAILGYREGDVVEWEVPAGLRRIRIQTVLYQPEAAGHEHLKYSVLRKDNAFSIPDGAPLITAMS